MVDVSGGRQRKLLVERFAGGTGLQRLLIRSLHHNPVIHGPHLQLPRIEIFDVHHNLELAILLGDLKGLRRVQILVYLAATDLSVNIPAVIPRANVHLESSGVESVEDRLHGVVEVVPGLLEERVVEEALPLQHPEGSAGACRRHLRGLS